MLFVLVIIFPLLVCSRNIVPPTKHTRKDHSKEIMRCILENVRHPKKTQDINGVYYKHELSIVEMCNAKYAHSKLH